MGDLQLLLFDNHLIKDTTQNPKDLMQKILHEYQRIEKPVQLSGLKIFPRVSSADTRVYVLGEGSIYEMDLHSNETNSLMFHEPEKFKGLWDTLQKTVEKEKLQIQEPSSKDLTPVCIYRDYYFQLKKYPDHFFTQLKAHITSSVDRYTSGPFNSDFFKPRAYNDQGVYVISANTMFEMTYGCYNEECLSRDSTFRSFYGEIRDYMKKELKLLTPKPKVVRPPKADNPDQGSLF